MAVVVFLHAHPDDESILTGGTMRALAERGHTVVLVTATNGEAGLTDRRHFQDLAETRMAELQASSRILGVSAVHWLGYADSGLDGDADGTTGTFCKADLDAAAERLAEILRAANATVLVGYDSQGGYGHPDHVQVHKVAHRAAELAATPVLMEATWDRQSIARLIDRVRPLLHRFRLHSVLGLADGFTARADISHQIDVRRWASPKRAAMKAHASQLVGGGVRSLQVFASLPRPLFRRMFGTEWYRLVWQRHVPNPFDELPVNRD